MRSKVLRSEGWWSMAMGLSGQIQSQVRRVIGGSSIVEASVLILVLVERMRTGMVE